MRKHHWHCSSHLPGSLPGPGDTPHPHPPASWPTLRKHLQDAGPHAKELSLCDSFPIRRKNLPPRSEGTNRINKTNEKEEMLLN